MNINDIKSACRINVRITNLGKSIAELLNRLDPEFDGDEPTIYWEGHFDDDTIELTITYAEMVNESCHCHPEYRLHTQKKWYTLSHSDILNDDYFDENDEVLVIPGSEMKKRWGGYWYRYQHPVWLKIEEELEYAKMEREDQEKAKKWAEEERQRKLDQQRELAELARLQSKYAK